MAETGSAGTPRVWPALDIVARLAESAEHAPSEPSPAEHASSEQSDVAIEGLLLAFLDDYSPTAIVDSPGPGVGDRPAWRVFFASPGARDRARAALAQSEWDARVETDRVDVEDEGWAARSQATLTKVQVGRIIVAPPWDLPTADEARDAIVIEIEPSMGFGTGHHQSTRLCLRALQAMDVAGRRAIDLGTGSGVLSIAAARLGATSVLGLDDDADAVEAALKNVSLNGVGSAVRIERADLTASTATEPAGLVLANLTGALLVRYAAAVVRHASIGGLLVLSGFTEDERFSVAHAYRDLAIAGEDREDGWIGLTLRRMGVWASGHVGE